MKQAHADFGARDEPASLAKLAEGCSERIEINGLFEIASGPKLQAVLLGLTSCLAADDKNWDHLCAAKGSKGLTQFVARVFRHSEIEQNCVRLVFKGEGEALLGFT